MPESDRSRPQYTPTPRELDDVELLRMGVLSPLEGFEGADGEVTLSVPETLVEWARERGGLEITDPEGVPLATVSVDDTYPAGPGLTGIVGEVGSLPGHIRRAFGRLYVPPSASRTRLTASTITVPVDAPLTASDLAALQREAGDRPVLFLVLAGAGSPRGLSPHGLIRATVAAAKGFPDSNIIAVPAAVRESESHDLAFRRQVVAAYAPGDVYWPVGDGPLTDAVEAVVADDRPLGLDQGLVVFFTGLSGSGKSTLAQALSNWLLETGGRSVSLLDGDIVRRNLSRGLSFSREDREANIERIGWVAAEIARHGGLAICSPIAPFDHTRKAARSMADEVGAAFVLVHVATPLEECERRDRKGLYAKARRGEIEQFTGISSPYEVPVDADLAIDTTNRSIDDVLSEILAFLVGRGWLPVAERDAVTLGAT
ncbi:adenylyl-sulfate kinase [Aeromicrobium sp.]|uniref:adenylyl-sulfate kinase n=1 Tax=Aeromicrobium sp. TaxID=1871063 RepID=UPI003D6BAB8D